MTRGVLTVVRAAVKAGAMDVVEKPYRMDARRSTDVGGSSDILGLLPLPRFAGVTNARCLLFGANTP